MAQRTLKYGRVLLKLSGEALAGTEGFGIAAPVVDRLTEQIKKVHEGGVSLGLVVGGIASLGVGRLMQGLLYGVPAGDPVALGIGTAVLLTAALLACGLPALRARRLDPVAAIRAE